jgi:hypothetical protein
VGGNVPIEWCHNDAGWSSLVARRAHNPKVAGSNPAPATKSPGQRVADQGFYRVRRFFYRVFYRRFLGGCYLMSLSSRGPQP